jgi:benzoate-CoA ligase
MTPTSSMPTNATAFNGVPALGDCMQMQARFNFAQHLLSTNAQRGDKTAFIGDGATLSYGELHTQVQQFASGLLAMGLHPEERVLLYAQDSIDWPVAFLPLSSPTYSSVIPHLMRDPFRRAWMDAESSSA